MRGYFRKTILSEDKNLQSYVIGLALGDGNLSCPNGRATRLRITCDKKYPLLIQRIFDSLGLLFPQNKVSLVERNNNCLDISVYSNHLEDLLCWKAKGGPKFVQNASIPEWIKQNTEYKINCLKGLIETDGCIYTDREYKMVNFSTIIPNLAKDVGNMINSLGFNAHTYRIDESKIKKYYPNQKTIYRVRLSKNVSEFLDLVKPEKF